MPPTVHAGSPPAELLKRAWRVDALERPQRAGPGPAR
jgi:hypothetical protein